MSRFIVPRKLAVVAAVAQLVGMPAAAQDRLSEFERAFDRTGEHVECISTNRIRSTRVIDDRHILFRLGPKRYVLNTLPRACALLGIRRSFGYESVTARLCRVDSITVLDEPDLHRFLAQQRDGTRLHGLLRGPRCGLGDFELVVEKNLPYDTGSTSE